MPTPHTPPSAATPRAAPAAPSPAGLSAGMVFVFAAASGLTVANIYYAQPLLGPISAALGMPAGTAGLIMTLVQVGYGAGLLLLVPLADVVENRRLILALLGGVVLGLAGVAGAGSAAAFLAASFLVGVCAVATQVLVPFASQLVPDARRGRTVGNIMAGLLGGIMLARPVASAVASAGGWRAVFVLSAAAMAALMLALWRALPQRRPSGGAGYAAIIASLPGIVRGTPLLRRRSFYQAMMFAGFQAFWTAAPLMLAREFGLDQRGMALFAFAGASGALAAPLAGRLADRGLTRLGTGVAQAAGALSFAAAALSVHFHSMAGLVLSVVVLDAMVQLNHVLGLRSIYMLAPALRGRLNGLYMASIFAVGAAASGLSAAAYAFFGWDAVCLLGGGAILLAFCGFLAEPRDGAPAGGVRAPGGEAAR
ncbi:MAG: MFS transporter [Xylophilus ampelinus]